LSHRLSATIQAHLNEYQESYPPLGMIQRLHTLQAELFALTLALDGVPLYGYDKYVSAGELRLLYDAVCHRELAPIPILQAFTYIRMPSAVTLGEAIRAKATFLIQQLIE